MLSCRNNFARKDDAVVTANLKVAHRAYEYTRDRYAADFNYWNVLAFLRTRADLGL